MVHPHVKQEHTLGLVAGSGTGWAQLVGSNPPCLFFILFLGPFGPLTYGPHINVVFTTEIRDTYVTCRARTDVSISGTVLITYFHVPGPY